MTKFKVDINKGLYEQTWWNLLKPEVKLKAIKHWKDTDKIVDEKISKGEVHIDSTISPRNLIVDIPTTDLIKFTNSNKPIPIDKENKT
tara:strand:- start:130 stop:393 length:264 start_codon:yes stop_codon:yes gene_type:complete